MKTLIEQLEQLELEDPNSKGCTICLGEYLNNSMVNIINNFIEEKIKEAWELGYKDGESSK